jgi:uncharacterized phage protein gp47/JayE
MVDTPKISGPDGALRTITLFSTTASERFFEGTMDPSTVDMQVSIRGGAFTSSPDFIVFGKDTFVIPNPSAFPEGLELAEGLNVIEIRSVSFSGAVSAPARIEVTLIQDADIGLVGSPPTNISIERFEESVNIRVEGVNDSRFRGVNFYASRFQGGGSTGYQRVNLNTISDFKLVQDKVNIRNLLIQNAIAKTPDGSPAADPLYIKIKETQTSSRDVVQNLETLNLSDESAAAITLLEQQSLLKTDFVDVFEVPETTTSISTQVIVDSIVERKFYTFSHNRLFGPSNTPPTVAVAEFQATPTTRPLYYVASAVYFDPNTQTEVLSVFSPEVVGQPVTVDAAVGSFPSPSRLDIAQDVIVSLNRTTPQLGVAPGNVIRDTFVDPFSQEATRLRFLVDFLYRIQSFDTLLDIDGVDSSGRSVAVANSPYKTALQRVLDLSSTRDVQTVINNAFDQLAARNNVFRKAGTRAQGSVTFFTRTPPNSTVFIPVGTRVASGSVTFVTTTDASFPINNLSAFFNPVARQYQVVVSVVAENTGSAGNLSTGQIRTVLSNLPGLSVTNTNPTFGGQSQETNFALATRARSSFASVDSGTEQGIRQIAAEIPGVASVTVVSAGDPLMQRDFDEDFNKHVGGKVDVWLRGGNPGRFTDTFAFNLESAFDVRFVSVGNPKQLRFRALDPTLSPDNPISGFLDNESLGLGLRNASTGSFFNLEGATFPSWDLVQLADAPSQPTLSAGDILLGDYRYVSSTKFQFTRQPVSDVVQVVGQASGTLPRTNWRILRTADPLKNGRSGKAAESLEILQINGFPNSQPISVTNERHVLLGEFEEFLNNIGANPLTLRVYNSGKTVEFRGPNDPSGVSDFVVIPGTATTSVAIRRTSNSKILSGETVLVDYEHAENFTVTYEVEQSIERAQELISNSSHLTADILVKSALRVPVDISATVALSPGVRRGSVDTAVRANLATLIRITPQGGAIRQSDILAVVDNTRGVSFVNTPLSRMARAEGTLIVREKISSASSDLVFLTGDTSDVNSTTKLSNANVSVFLLQDELSASTEDGGGPSSEFRAVYQDGKTLSLISSSIFEIAKRPGQAFIIGFNGASIPGYSDTETIQANFPTATTLAAVQEIREQLTANRVVVSVGIEDRPSLHEYSVTYVSTFVENEVRDLEAGDLEFFDVGEIVLTYAEDTRG